MSKVEEMIIASLKELAKIANEQDGKLTEQESKLIFPKYCCGEHAGEKRISEQEERLLFIRELEKRNEFYYSIETPTTKSYNFSDKKEPKIASVKEGRRSASFDLTLYDKNFTRKHFIEFKNKNVDTVKKDFLKLLCDENNKENYFVNIIERDNLSKRGTLKSIEVKYQEAVNYVKDKINNIEHTNSTLKIVLFNINDEPIQFKDICLCNNTTIERLPK